MLELGLLPRLGRQRHPGKALVWKEGGQEADPSPGEDGEGQGRERPGLRAS